jgi:CRISPR-associated protein Csb2
VKHLAIRAVFKDCVYTGRRLDNAGSEFPPSPYRLYQALLSSAHYAGNQLIWDENAKHFEELFVFFESLRCDTIFAPKFRKGAEFVWYVPKNEGDTYHAQTNKVTEGDWLFGTPAARTEKLVANIVVEDNPIVTYLYPLEEADERKAEEFVNDLHHAFRDTSYVGRSTDLVHLSASIINDTEVLKLPGQRLTLLPSKSYSARSLPVPIPGTFNELRKVHQSWEKMNAVPGNLTNPRPRHEYGLFYLRTETILPQRPVAKFLLRRLDDRDRPKTYSLSKTLEVAGLLRHATLHAAQNSHQNFPGGVEQYVAGHIRGREATVPRFAYLPLPSIGHQYTDPGIRRAVIAEPIGGDGSLVQWVRDTLDGCVLQNNGYKIAQLVLTQHNTVFEQYEYPANTFITMTPVILAKGYKPRRHRKAIADALWQAIQEAGIPLDLIRTFEFDDIPYTSRSIPAKEFRVPEEYRHRERVHVRLTFKRAIPGPIVIGSGRFRGMGLFCPYS